MTTQNNFGEKGLIAKLFICTRNVFVTKRTDCVIVTVMDDNDEDFIEIILSSDECDMFIAAIKIANTNEE